MGSPAKARRLSMSMRFASAEPVRQAGIGGGGNPSRLWAKGLPDNLTREHIMDAVVPVVESVARDGMDPK
eukprot:9021007-Lingulodinium_polyedra.AAC.1